MDSLSTSDDACKDDMSENNDADSNSSDALVAENKNKQSKKKSLNDMLRKLNPEGDDSTTSQGLPAFLQKNSQSTPIEMACNSDPEMPSVLEPSTPVGSKTSNDPKSGGSNVVPAQRVSSPKSSADVYKCYVDACSLAFSQITDFKQHIHTMHQDVSSIPCCFCYSTFKRENIFDHLALHIKNVMKCIYCQVSQDTREELLKHLSEKHPNQPKKINVCIRILNNVRSKKATSEQNPEPKPAIKICFPAPIANEQSSNTVSEVPKSRKTRKPAKPLKTQVSLATDEMEIHSFENELPISCDQCTFSCSTDKLLRQHLQEGHVSPCTKALLFKCKQCKMATDCKDTFVAHLSHHKGCHTLRCFLCPYCTVTSNNMDTIEEHVGDKHPKEVFRFEVLQEKINYLQNMLACPICNSGYVWQKSFLSHLASVHQLKDVVEYLSKNYDEKSLPDKAKVPRSYFRNLLPDAPDYDVDHDHLGDADGISREESYSTGVKDEPTSILEAHLLGSSSQDEEFSGMFDFSERFPPADLSQYIVKKGTPTTFSCDMCPFECSKTAHFRRHLEVHKRNESLTEGYKCGYCQFMHNRLNCIRFHLGKYHSDKPYKMTRIIDNSIISYGPEDDPTLGRSKAKKPFLTSTPVEKEKRPMKFEPSSPMLEDDLQVIAEFEKQLPTAMIYQDPIKCPKCDFSNRVRINLLRHLKLHKVERLLNGSLEEQSISTYVDPTEENNVEEEESKNKSIPNPLLEFLTNSKGSSCDGDFLEDAEEVTFVSRSDLTDEYKYFSIKLPNGNQYQCKECKFVHRYPSKVKRHYYYKHAPAFPFKCGYCSFGAVESGKVKRHCKLVHKHKREMVIKRNVYKKEDENPSQQAVGKATVKKEIAIKPADEIEEGVRLKYETISQEAPDGSGDLWLPQFVTMLDDNVQCCKLCGYQQEGSSSLRDHVFYAHMEFYPYSCIYCGFALMDAFRVKKHIDMHHSGMAYVAVKRQIREDSADNSTGDMVVDESSQLSSNLEDSIKKERLDEDDEVRDNNSSTKDFTDDCDTGGGTLRRQFKCHYCGVISKWNRRDIRLHILHVHLRKKVYTCRHCGFGNSKSKAIVRSHCMKFHPTKNVSVRDELVLFNAIVPIDDTVGIVTMALSNKDGTPVLTLPNEEDSEKAPTQHQPSIKVENKMTRSSSILNSSGGASSSKTANSYLRSDRWKCKECCYASNSEVDVKYHLIASHMNLRPYSCPHCHIYMNKSESVSAHIDRIHPGKHKNVLHTIVEKAAYLQKNMECLFNTHDNDTPLNEDEDIIDADFARVMEQQTNPRYSSGYFRCLICGYRDPRNDKTKYHIIKNHLNLRQFSCPHCNVYMWGRQQVIIHIEEAHPGKEVFVKRTFQEYDEFLRKSIKRFPYPRSIVLPQTADTSMKIITKAVPRINCNSCSFVTDSELSLAAHKRTHKIFQCFYCDFKHMLAARVQSHCLVRHPYKLVRLKQINSSNFESTKVEATEPHEANSDESEVEFEKDEGDCAEKGDQENGSYMCQMCKAIKYNKADIIKHMSEVHKSGNRNYTFIKTKMEAGDDSENGMEVDEMELEEAMGDLPIKMNNVQNTKFSTMSPQLARSRTTLYQCKLCTYKSNKMTVMRHHIMSHLRYHPYVCPYCDVARSVKSFPIKKHVMSKHPGKEIKSIHCVDEEIETKIANSYYKLKFSSLAESSYSEVPENNLEDEEEEENDEDLEEAANMYEVDLQPPAEAAPQNNFKCKFCDFETSIRTSMKHHLMKEINYQPLKCGNCNFSNSQRPVLSKHYQMKHPGCEVEVKEEVNGEKEELVKKMLDEICTKNEPQLDTSLSPLRQAVHNTRFSANLRSTQSSQMQTTSPLKQLDPIPLKSNPKMLKCPECSYTNNSMKLVRGHMIKHGPYRFKCSYCDYHAHYPSRIRKHTKTQHQGLTFKFTKVTDFSNIPSSNKAEVLRSNHSDSPGAVYLDGVLMDLPFKAHPDGWYRCQYCDYKSLDRDNFKVHLVTHKPPRWKCFHCNQRYPVVFRVRRHCLTKHPKLPIKWMDVETGKVFANSKSSDSSSNTSKHDATRNSFGSDSLGVLGSSSDSTSVMKFSCHLCDFFEFSNSTSSLLKHLKVEHFWSDKLPSIEILPTGDEGEVWALRRCGFCAFETYDSDVFRCHVLQHTVRPPVQCVFCSFASFSRSVVTLHAKTEHKDEVRSLHIEAKNKEDMEMKDAEKDELSTDDKDDTKADDVDDFMPDHLLYKELREGYILSAQEDNERPLQWSGGFAARVRLTNVMP